MATVKGTKNEASPEKLIIDFVVELVEKYWDKIDTHFWGIEKSKAEFIKEVKVDVQTAIWVLVEVFWMDNFDLIKDLLANTNLYEFLVLAIKDKYIKLEYEPSNHEYKISFCEKKTKTVSYFE